MVFSVSSRSVGLQIKCQNVKLQIEFCEEKGGVDIYLKRMASGDGGRRVSSESIAFHSFKHDCSEPIRSS